MLAPELLERLAVSAENASVLTLLQHPDARLRQRSRPATTFDDELVILAGAMAATMQRAQGIGLAAPQVGLGLRLVVMRLEGRIIALANPQIIAREGVCEDIQEGCLSVADRRGAVRRAAWVQAKAQSLAGEDVQFELDGLPAVCLQHEIDHLDGILFIDRLAQPEADTTHR